MCNKIWEHSVCEYFMQCGRVYSIYSAMRLKIHFKITVFPGMAAPGLEEAVTLGAQESRRLRLRKNPRFGNITEFFFL